MHQVMRSIKGPIQARLTIPGSKSMTYRAIILAALADGVSEITGLYLNESTKTLINALHQLGIVTQLDEKTNSCIFAGCNGKLPKTEATIWCGDSAVTARFLLATCANTAGRYSFDGSSQLRQKSFSPLLENLLQQGVQIIPSEARKLPFMITGNDVLEGGNIIFNDTAPNQLISALLMISPFAYSPFTFTMNHMMNHPAVDLTCAMMADFGVSVYHINHGKFMVPIPQRYQAKDYVIEPDLSVAAYFFAAAAVSGGEITIQSINRPHAKQADIKFLTVLEKMGCRVFASKKGLTVKGPHQLQGLDVDMHDFDDCFSALVAIAPFAKTPVRITHIGHARKKVAKQIQALKNEMRKIAIHVEAGEDWIRIFPSTPRSGIVNAFSDTQLAMAFAILGLKIPNLAVENAVSANAARPDYFNLLNTLAEQVNEKA